MKYEAKLSVLDHRLAEVWREILNGSRFVAAIRDGSITKRLFAMYMVETYHYVRHNPRTQALVGVRAMDQPYRYINYCFKHARDETGHEELALSDARELEPDLPDVSRLKPLPATETLIAYLYWVSFQGNPVQRLGYSYWAENCYRYINPIIQRLQEVLGLRDDQLTFFIAHSNIDEKHAVEVAEMVTACCRNAEDFEDLMRVMETSLRLTWRMMDEVYAKQTALSGGMVV